MTEDLHVVLGAGPVGTTLSEHLASQGRRLRVVTRSGTASAPPGAEVIAADVSDPEAAAKACAGASVVYGCVGLDYRGWPDVWPPLMAGMLAGAESAGARFVFMDNCYMYGPQTSALTEDLPLTSYGRKPSTRSELTRMWQTAHEEGRVQAVAVRAADFYGPGVINSALGELSFGRIAQGKSAQIVGDPDQLHSFTYVPDIARALIDVGDEPKAFGQAWNVPNAPASTMRQILTAFAAEVGQDVKIQSMPKALMAVVGLFNVNVRELKEMLYQWERPFVVDSTKFEQQFWADATTLDDGIAATAASYTKLATH